MSQPQRPPLLPAAEPVRRVEAGPWTIELLPGSAYSARYVATQSAIGFAFDSQRGLHAIGSDRVQPFVATPNSLAFVPAGCDVLSESPGGGEYLRVVHAQGLEVIGDHAFNNRIDPQAIALALRKARVSRVVNLSSVAATLGSPGQYVDYAAAKGAIDAFTIGLAKEVAAEGIRVNAVRPGLIETEIHASGGLPNRVNELKHQVPMQRGGTADEVAQAIVWLLSDAASYTTMSLLDVSGGR